MIEEGIITSLQNPQIKRLRSLHEKKYRNREKLFIAEGLRILEEARSFSFWPRNLVFTKRQDHNPKLKSLIASCREAGCDILQVSEAVMAKLARKDNPQSVLGVFDQFNYALDRIDVDGYKRFVLLEQVRDPGNLGTILRTADATHCGGVILIDDCCDPFSPEAVRASMGSLFALPVIKTSWKELHPWMQNRQSKGNGINIIGATLQDAENYRTPGLFKPPCFLLMGNEQKGLTETARKACNACVKIPMLGKADSLNLAVATSVILYEMLAQQA